MSVQHDAAIDLRRRVTGQPAFEKLAQKERLRPQTPGARVVRKQAPQLVTKHRRAARLEDHDRYAGVNRNSKCCEHALEILLRMIDEPEVIEWAAAAEPLARHEHTAAGGAEHVERGSKR